MSTTTPATIDRDVHEARRTVRQFWNFANLCYCGTPSLLLQQILDGLNTYDSPGDRRFGDDHRLDLNDRGNLLLAYMLDAWELTEHGTTMYWGWLTRDGIRLRDALRRVDLDTALHDDWRDNEYALYPKGRTRPDELLEGEWESENS